MSAFKSTCDLAFEWNVVATVAEHEFKSAVKYLRQWGTTCRTHFYNVVVMRVENPQALPAKLAVAIAQSPGILNFVSHVFPAQQTFNFGPLEEFERTALSISRNWLVNLSGKRFHVRLHRRGCKGVLSTPKEERWLNTALLAELHGSGSIGFDNPDVIIQIETVDQRVGISFWTRDDLQKYPFLGVD